MECQGGGGGGETPGSVLVDGGDSPRGELAVEVPTVVEELSLAAQRREHRCDFPACDKVRQLIIIHPFPFSRMISLKGLSSEMDGGIRVVRYLSIVQSL